MMGILGFILMVGLVLVGISVGVEQSCYIDVGSAILTVVVTLAALLMSYGSGLCSATKAVFACEASKDDLRLGVAVFTKGKSYAVASGSLGTLIGLVVILKNLDDVSAMGPGLALALLTLVYGIVLAYLVLGPVVGSLRRRLEEDQ